MKQIHYTMFLGFARQFGNREEVDSKWQSLLEYEAKIMRNLGTKMKQYTANNYPMV